jgi:transposase
MAWRSGQSYSEDLRERVLAAVDRGMGVYEAASLSRVSVSYIYKALGRRRLTGEAAVRPRLGRPGQKLAILHDALLARVTAEPGATLAELRGWLLAEHGVSVSTGCLWAALDRLELMTHKKCSGPLNRTARTWPRHARNGASSSPVWTRGAWCSWMRPGPRRAWCGSKAAARAASAWWPRSRPGTGRSAPSYAAYARAA